MMNVLNKKLLCTVIVATFFTFPVSLLAQSFYLSAMGGISSSAFKHKINPLCKTFGKKGERNSDLGNSVILRYSYFFSEYGGLSTGVGLSLYDSTEEIKGDIQTKEYLSLGIFMDHNVLSADLPK